MGPSAIMGLTAQKWRLWLLKLFPEEFRQLLSFVLDKLPLLAMEVDGRHGRNSRTLLPCPASDFACSTSTSELCKKWKNRFLSPPMNTRGFATSVSRGVTDRNPFSITLMSTPCLGDTSILRNIKNNYMHHALLK